VREKSQTEHEEEFLEKQKKQRNRHQTKTGGERGWWRVTLSTAVAGRGGQKSAAQYRERGSLYTICSKQINQSKEEMSGCHMPQTIMLIFGVLLAEGN